MKSIAMGLLSVVCLAGCADQLPVSPGPSETDTMLGQRNQDTQVWLIPPPAGDLINLATHPEWWPEAAKRTDVVSLYQLEGYTQPDWKCGIYCGPNDYQSLVDAVPGGVFKWLSDRFILAHEGGSVKPHACTAKQIDGQISLETRVIDNIDNSGGHLSYLSLDEPFTSGVQQGLFWDGKLKGCDLTQQEVAVLQKRYNDGIHATHPEVQIGLIEPYPHFTVDQLMSFINELEAVGIRLPYFHLDFDQPQAVREGSDWKSDIPRLYRFCHAKGIPFGVILVGWNGHSDEEFATGYWSVVRPTFQAVGVTDHTILQSWAEDPTGGPDTLKQIPHVVPETQDTSMTGLLRLTLDFMGIRPR